MIIDKCHSRNLHGGVGETLNEVRSEFWIPQGRQRVKNRIQNFSCVQKIRRKASLHTSIAPIAGPSERVKNMRPFSVMGIDHAGAITVEYQEVK